MQPVKYERDCDRLPDVLKSGSDFEPLETPRTVWAVSVYALLATILLILTVILMSVTSYRENAGLTLEAAQQRTRAVLPVVVALLGSGLAFGVAARLCWLEHRWTILYGALLFIASILITASLPSSLRGYGGFVVIAQMAAIGLYARLRRPRA
jgi:magnesium-transporting ATPase (P-type)